MMKHFNVLEIFNSFEDESYCLIKRSDIFPKYIVGSDFDIFCYDAISVSEKIVSCFNEYISENITIRLITNDKKIVVDILDGDAIHLRFDLYRELPGFNHVNIRESFFVNVIENHQILKFNNQKIIVPSHIDESIIRYIEYHEWFDSRPDKIKHVHMIEEFINDKKINRKTFFNKIHYYLKFPIQLDSRRVSQNSLIRKLSRLFKKFKRVLKTMRTEGILSTCKTIIKRLKRV